MNPVTRSSPGRAVLGVILLTLAAVSATAKEATDPFEATKAQFMAAEGFEAQMTIVKSFLADHPNNAHAGDVVEVGADLFIDQRNDRPAAVALAENQLKVSTDPEVVSAIQGVLIGLYSDPAYAFKLETLVGEIYDPATMRFTEHLKVLGAAAAADAWPLVDAQCKAALEKANAETFAADYPDREFSDEETATAGRNREGMILTYVGWSMANQGNARKAMGQYKKAESSLRPSFAGVPTNELYRYWGQTLLMRDDAEEGLEKLTLAAIYGGDDQADEIARKSFADIRPSDTYDDYTWTLRREYGPEMVDFSTTDYQDATRTFHELKGRKATLVAFWFPT